MHYYKRNIGDYAKKAGRLSMLQHGAYTLILDSCYDREQFPTREQAIEWSWASSKEEIEAVDFVLSRFFIPEEDGTYTQARVLEELLEYANFCELQAEKGKRGGRPKKPNGIKNKPTGFLNKANGKPDESQCKAGESLTTNQEPLTTNQNTKPTRSPKAPPCKTQEIIELFSDRCPSLIHPRVVADSVRGMIADRWRQDPNHQTLEFWRKFFDYCESLDFLTGRSPPTRGEKSFRVGLEWIVKAGNFAKIINGNYANG